MKLFVFNVLMGSGNFLCFLLTPVLMFFLSLLLSLSMLHQVHQFSNKQTEMALRVASLDYLGTVAARLRKDAVTSKMDQRSIDRILQQVEEQLHIWHFMATKISWMVQAENVCYSWVFLWLKVLHPNPFAVCGSVLIAHFVIFLSVWSCSLKVTMIPSSCRRLYWTTWRIMLRRTPHWWCVYIRLTERLQTLQALYLKSMCMLFDP